MNNENLAVYEYYGLHVMGGPHGNTQVNIDVAAPYVRTPANVMDEISSKLSTERPQEMYRNFIVDREIHDAPRDSRVIHNKKATVRRQRQQSSGIATCHNFADEIQELYRISQSDDFVRCIISTKNRVPSIIVYDDRQISDLKGFCFNKPNSSVLGFDKTFNLGSMYVTPCVYKNLSLLRKRTNDNPIFVGPIYIHGHSDFETYSYFMSHLSVKLADCNSQQLTLGSDDELAMRKCFRHFFPRATCIVCSRHLKENVIRQLDELMGKNSTIRHTVMNQLFGTTGLVHCDDIVSFDEAVENFRNNTLKDCPQKFVEYFNNRLVKIMRSNVEAGPDRSTWTNNNCESFNHVLKQSVQWRPHQIPQLIDILRSIVSSQFAEADRAMCGIGDYTLHPSYAKHRLTIDVWSNMSNEQRRRAAANCFKIISAAPTVTSTDGAITVPTTPGGGKKPHQKKRSRNERTTTVSKKKPRVDDVQ